MRGPLLCSLALFAAGCTTDQEFADALPTADQVSIKVPQSGSNLNMRSEGGLGQQQAALLGATAELYQITVGISSSINVGTALIVGAVHLIASQAPTSRTTDSRTWGPWSPGGLDPMSYRLVVTKLGDLHHSFSLDASSRLATNPTVFLPIVDGDVRRGARAGTGSGTMTLHFDNRRQLVADACENGTLTFTFDTTSDPVTNDVSLHGFANNNPANILCSHDQVTNASYHFDQDTTGAGDFVFAFTKDMVQPVGQTTAVDEDVTIRSRWRASGAGRSDIAIAGADVAAVLVANNLAGPVTAGQCWDAQFKTVFESTSPAQLAIFPSDGDAGACAYTDAQLP